MIRQVQGLNLRCRRAVLAAAIGDFYRAIEAMLASYSSALGGRKATRCSWWMTRCCLLKGAIVSASRTAAELEYVTHRAPIAQHGRKHVDAMAFMKSHIPATP